MNTKYRPLRSNYQCPFFTLPLAVSNTQFQEIIKKHRMDRCFDRNLLNCWICLSDVMLVTLFPPCILILHPVLLCFPPSGNNLHQALQTGWMDKKSKRDTSKEYQKKNVAEKMWPTSMFSCSFTSCRTSFKMKHLKLHWTPPPPMLTATTNLYIHIFVFDI